MSINLQAPQATGVTSQLGPATLKYSAFNQPGNFAGLTIAQVRAQYAGRWEMEADSEVFKQGKVSVGEDYVIGVNDVITFSKATGEKG